MPDIDPQLQRARAHQRRQPPCLQILLHLAARFLRHAAVVRPDRPLRPDREHPPVAHHPARRQSLRAPRFDLFRLLGRKLRVQAVGRALGEAAAVREDEGAAMAADLVEHAGDQARPDAVRRQIAEILDRRHDLEVQVLAVAGVDDRHRARPQLRPARFLDPLLPAEEARHLLERFLRGRQADALDVSGHARQPFQRQREVYPAFVPAQRVDLVHDHGTDVAEHPARTRAGEHQEQRLGGGDQDVRRGLEHLLAGVGRGVAGAHGHAQLRQRRAELPARAANPLERRAQVALHIVVQRLQGRHVQDMDPTGTAGTPTAASILTAAGIVAIAGAVAVAGQVGVQPVDRPQERRQRLAGAGGCEQQACAPRAGSPATPRPAVGLLRRRYR